MRLAILSLAVLLVASCATVQNLSVSDVRTPERECAAGSVSVPISQIKECADRTNYSCGPGQLVANIMRDPDNENKASLFIYGLGATQMNPYVIIDFEGQADGTSSYRAFTAIKNLPWKRHVEKQLRRIEACGECSKLP